MRLLRVCVVVSLLLVLAIPVFAHTSTAQSSPQALTLLQQSLAALTAGKSISDITLSGAARRIAGSDDESGTATLKALASGVGRMDLSLSSGARSEIANLTTDPPTGSWSGPDGISHVIAFHNLLTETCWFFPAFAIARRLTTSGFVATLVGEETRNGQSVQHVTVSQTPPSPDSAGATLQYLTQVDFFLDSSSLLPTAIRYNAHPDNDSNADIAIEIRFSNYQNGSGTPVPMHIQQYINNALALDIQIQNAAFNSGLTAASFNVK